jgi:hypothetical protein
MKLRSVQALVLAGLLGLPAMARAQVTHNSITLSWTTPGDDSLQGQASQFDLRYSTSPITAANFGAATRFTAMPAPAASGTRQSVVVTGLSPATTYYFAIKTADEVPNWALISNLYSRATLAAPDTVRPAPVATLAVTALTDTTATLSWNAVGDDSLTGTASTYDIRYSTSPITLANWTSASQVTGEPAPQAPGSLQTYQVRGLARQTRYYFAIRVADDAGQPSALSNVPSATTLDTMPPAAIRDLAIGFLWSNVTMSAAWTRPDGFRH